MADDNEVSLALRVLNYQLETPSLWLVQSQVDRLELKVQWELRSREHMVPQKATLLNPQHNLPAILLDRKMQGEKQSQE